MSEMSELYNKNFISKDHYPSVSDFREVTESDQNG